MTISKRRAWLLATLLTLVPVHQAFTQELRPVGTLTIAEISALPVQVFSAGVSYNVPPTGPGGGGPTGQAYFSTFSLTKFVDGTSPLLLVNAASGRLFPQARIDLFGPDGITVLATYELLNVMVLGAVVNDVLTGTKPCADRAGIARLPDHPPNRKYRGRARCRLLGPRAGTGLLIRSVPGTSVPDMQKPAKRMRRPRIAGSACPARMLVFVGQASA